MVFSIRQKICNARIAIITEPHPGRFSHHVNIETLEDIDDKLISWLKQAYNDTY